MSGQKKIAILVAGMPRSGISVSARVLNLIGCDLPNNLMEAGADNEKGHWESLPIAEINNKILVSAGSTWDDWRPFDLSWYNSPVADRFRQRAGELLREEFGESRLFILKDPRMCRLLPFWIEAVGTYGAKPLVVSPIRNPLDVAAALEERDGIDPSIGHLLWLRHVLDVEKDTRGMKRAWLRYNALLSEPFAVVDGIGDALGVSWPRSTSVNARIEIDEFVSPSMSHHRGSDARLLENPKLSHWIKSTFDIFNRWSGRDVHDKDVEELDRIRTAFDAASPAFSFALASSDRAVAEREGRIEELGRAVAEREGRIEELTSSTSWLITKPLRSIKKFFISKRKFVTNLSHDFVRRVFYAAPLSPATRHALRKLYRRLTSKQHPIRVSPVPVEFHKGDSYVVENFSALEAYIMKQNFRFTWDFFRDNQHHIRTIAAALSSPEDKGPVFQDEIDITPISSGPLVTIIVRTYRGRWPLTEIAIQSIQSQSYRPIEVIVVEDGGKEYADRILSFNIGDDCEFRHLSTVGGDQGRSAAANLGLDNAKGDFVGFLDDDDYFLPIHCGLLIAALMKTPEVDAIYAASKEVSAHLDVEKMCFTRKNDKAVYFSLMASPYALLDRNHFPIQAILFRRSIYSTTNRFDNNLDSMEDWLFWLRMLLRCRVAMIGEITSVFHIPLKSAESSKRLRAHLNAEEYFNTQRMAFCKVHEIRDMTILQEGVQSLTLKAIQRARLPVTWAGQSRVLPPNHLAATLKQESLYAALGKDAVPLHFEPIFSSRIVAFTSINLRYLPKALAWAQSVKQNNPDWETHILLNDAVPDDAGDWPNVDVVYPICRLNIPFLHSWIFMHKVTELCTATKPFYAKHLLESGYNHVFYFDPDTYVYHDLDFLVSEMEECDVLLTPHCTRDAIDDVEIHYNEISVLAHGVFNLGFIGFKQSVTGHAVADFWRRRLLRYCRDDHARGLFNDQKWFNLAPVFFDNLKILKHEGCNTASWNISHRPVKRENGEWFSGKDRLVFFHFSGYDRSVPRVMFDIFGKFGKHLEILIEEYDRTIARFSSIHKEWKSEWIYARFDNGELIKDEHREYYRNRFETQLLFPYPFCSDAEKSYRAHISKIGYQGMKEYINPPGLSRNYY